MNEDKLEIAKKCIAEHWYMARCGIFCTRNSAGDEMSVLYDKDGLRIEICYGWGYFEVFGLTPQEFAELEMYYDSL